MVVRAPAHFFDSLFEVWFNNCHLAVAILDREFNFVRVNEAYARADNRTPDQFPGSNHFDMYPSDAEAVFRKVVETKQPYQAFARPFEYSFARERGVTYWDWTLSPILNAQGGVDLLILTLIDVTQRIKGEIAALAAKSSEDKFATLFRLGSAPISIRSASDGTYLDVNQAWLSCVGYDYEEVIGKSSRDLNLHLDEETYLLLQHIGKNGITMRNKPIQFRRKTGEVRDGLTSADLIYVDGKPCILATTIDVTEHKAIDSELARLERLNLIGQMANGIGHEIRNPLTSVRGFLQLLKTQRAEGLPHYDLMISEIDRANTIISNFLELAKTKPEKLAQNNLNNVIKKLFPLLQAQALAANKDIVLSLGNVPHSLFSERELEQVVLNLASNALDASPENTSVQIYTTTEAEEIVLSITDHGPGIASDLLPRLGTPFLTTKDYGTGLGLAITNNIVKLHEGRIKIQSTNNGTTFSVYLPLKQ